MSVLTIVENWEGNFKKTSFESVSYAKKLAETHKTNLTVISFGSSNMNELTSYSTQAPLIIIFLSGDIERALVQLSASNKIKSAGLPI